MYSLLVRNQHPVQAAGAGKWSWFPHDNNPLSPEVPRHSHSCLPRDSVPGSLDGGLVSTAPRIKKH